MLDDEILLALKPVIDPELGVNIVDLGLVERADRTDAGIEVALIMTTPACPLGEMLTEQAEQALAQRFPHTSSIRVELLRDVFWTPERMTDDGRRQLGMPGAPPR
jgi:metal-sulfur cluster biosynthetic enzyme